MEITIPINIGDSVYSIEDGQVKEYTVTSIKVKEFYIKENTSKPELIINAKHKTNDFKKVSFNPEDINEKYFISTKALLKHITDQIL